MKQKRTAMAIIAIILVCVLVYFLLPKALVKDAEKLDIVRFARRVNGETHEITAQADLDGLKAILAKYKYSGIPFYLDRYPGDTIVYEIDAIDRHKILHIVLGQLNIVYESAQQGYHTIENSAALMKELDLLLKG